MTIQECYEVLKKKVVKRKTSKTSRLFLAKSVSNNEF